MRFGRVFGLLDGAAQRDGDGLPDPEFNRRNTNRLGKEEADVVGRRLTLVRGTR